MQDFAKCDNTKLGCRCKILWQYVKFFWYPFHLKSLHSHYVWVINGGKLKMCSGDFASTGMMVHTKVHEDVFISLKITC
jgi:hypothetical protein